jgi:RimJ/RimL family protein N-acetyltransferase
VLFNPFIFFLKRNEIQAGKFLNILNRPIFKGRKLKLKILDKADFGVIYEAELLTLGADWFKSRNLTKERMIEIFEKTDCRSLGFEIDGKSIGGILLLGNELHIAILPEYFGKWGLLWKHAVKWVFAQTQTVYGYIPTWNTRCIRFAEKARWRRIGEFEKYETACIGFELTAEEAAAIYRFKETA